jgi:hypothetical protein
MSHPSETQNNQRSRPHDDASQVGDSIKHIYEKTDVSKGELRLLRLLGGATRELRGNLVLREDLPLLEDKTTQPYAALSYTWGKGDRTSSMEILDGGNAYKFKITPNLEAILKRLVSEDRPSKPALQTVQYLWVDAICINQTDKTERNVQVRRMGHIFSEAEKVIVWLGEEKENSDKAIEFIPNVLNLDTAPTLAKDQRHIEDWDAFFNLLRRPWFSRRWVIQEIAFAQVAWIHCGGRKIRWDEFVDAVSLFSSMHKDLRQLFQSSGKHTFNANYLGDINELGAVRLIQTYNNLFRKSDEKGGRTPLLSLEQLVSQLPAFEASEPQDIIFAVLSLAVDVGPTHLGTASTNTSRSLPQKRKSSAVSPRPTKQVKRVSQISPRKTGHATVEPPQEEQSIENNPVARRAAEMFLKRAKGSIKEKDYDADYGKTFYEVAQDFLDWSMRKSGSLDILCRPWAPKNINDKLPSWISTLNSLAFRPDGRGVSQRVRADLLVGIPDKKRNYDASGKYASKWKFGSGSTEKRLFVDGFVLDTIEVKLLPAQSGIVPFEWLSAGGWKNTQDLPPDRFWRTIVADRGPDGQNPPSHYRRACKHAYDLGVDGDDLRTDKGIAEGCPEVVAEFLRRVQSVVWQRCLMLTKEYDMPGLVPYEAIKGDLICILYGCSVPVVLRERTDEVSHETYHVLVGESYVYSMMDTSAFDVRNKKLERLQLEGEKIETLTKTFELR